MKLHGYAGVLLISSIAVIAIGCSDKRSTFPDAGSGIGKDGPLGGDISADLPLPPDAAVVRDSPVTSDAPGLPMDVPATIDGAGDGSVDSSVARSSSTNEGI
jgi:hypothetical protein